MSSLLADTFWGRLKHTQPPMARKKTKKSGRPPGEWSTQLALRCGEQEIATLESLADEMNRRLRVATITKSTVNRMILHWVRQQLEEGKITVLDLMSPPETKKKNR